MNEYGVIIVPGYVIFKVEDENIKVIHIPLNP